MADVYGRFPGDLDIAALYADALMNIAPWQLWMRGWAVICWAPIVTVAERRGRRTLRILLMLSPVRAWASREMARAANTMVR